MTIQKDTNTSQETSKKDTPTLSIENPYPAPEIPPSLTEWINSNPLTMQSLK